MCGKGKMQDLIATIEAVFDEPVKTCRCPWIRISVHSTNLSLNNSTGKYLTSSSFLDDAGAALGGPPPPPKKLLISAGIAPQGYVANTAEQNTGQENQGYLSML